jgi:hypothetical protein
VDSIRHSVELLSGRDAARMVADADALAAELSAILADPGGAAKRARRGLEALAEHRGCTDRTVCLVETALARNAVD